MRPQGVKETYSQPPGLSRWSQTAQGVTDDGLKLLKSAGSSSLTGSLLKEVKAQAHENVVRVREVSDHCFQPAGIRAQGCTVGRLDVSEEAPSAFDKFPFWSRHFSHPLGGEMRRTFLVLLTVHLLILHS